MTVIFRSKRMTQLLFLAFPGFFYNFKVFLWPIPIKGIFKLSSDVIFIDVATPNIEKPPIKMNLIS